MTVDIVLPKGRGIGREMMMREFAGALKSHEPDFKMSSRGWCYYLEGEGLITKGEFNRAQNLINECRKYGFLAIDFVATDKARTFLFTPAWNDKESPIDYLSDGIDRLTSLPAYYDPDPWIGEKCYIQILVEKIDLVELFKPICQKMNIPIATAKGWSDINQRGEMATRFDDYEDRGLTPVLLYCGDHDPAGLFISDKLKKNFSDISQGYMESTGVGWDPSLLIVDRFGLNHDFIIDHDLTWIDNLETGSGLDLNNPSHKDHLKPYVQDYINKFGARKVEANAVVKEPESARALLVRTIEKYLGPDAMKRFQRKTDDLRREVQKLMDSIGVSSNMADLKEKLDEQY